MKLGARVRSPAVLAATLLLVGLAAPAALTDALEMRADGEHVKLAWNLAVFGVFSHQNREPPRPTWRREPLYPALLAVALRTGAEPETQHFLCIRELEPRCLPALRAMKRVNVLLLFALAIASWWAVQELLGAGWRAWLAHAAIVTNGVYWSLLDGFRSETPAALALLAGSVCLFRIARGSRRAADVLGAGVALGALMLLKAIFFYVAPVLLVLAVWLSLAPPRRRDAAVRLAIAALLAQAIGGAWAARNAAHGGPFAISDDRAVLAIRAEYDTMTWREWGASWLFFARDARPARLVLKRFVPEDAYARLRRSNPDGFYRKAKEDRGAAAAQLGPKRPPDARELSAAARRVILAHLPMHLALTGPLTIQSFYVYERYFGFWPVRKLQEWTSSWLVPGLLALSAWLLWRRRPEPFAFCLPALACLALHVGGTHCIARYSWPLLPVATISLAALPDALRERGAFAPDEKPAPPAV
jgi:4-amino-4-deoxy-L-arabinose transferase-like glycosyltransferase